MPRKPKELRVDAPTDASETITIRIPRTAKKLAEAAAASRGQTLTAWVLAALRDALAPRGYQHEWPGWSHQFIDFEEAAKTREVLILVRNPLTGHEGYYRGRFSKDVTGGGLVDLRSGGSSPKDQQVHLIPRVEIVAWYGWSDAPDYPKSVQEFATHLEQQGWVRLPRRLDW
jgi:hypothetical protein